MDKWFKYTSLPPRAKFLFFQTLMTQSIIVTFQHQNWKKNVLETKLLRHPPLQECYLQHHILTFHDLNQTSSILDEENVMQRKRSTHEKLLNIFTWLSAFHFCSTFNEHFLSYNICFLFYATIFN